MIFIVLYEKFRSTHTSHFVSSAIINPQTRVSDTSEQPIRTHLRGKILDLLCSGGISLNRVLILEILRKSKAVLIAFPLTR